MEIKLFFPVCDLPDTVFEQTLIMFSYHEISQLRRVNKRFNTICMALLNKGFRSADNYHTKYLKEVKAQLPRRESDRLNHKLSNHFDVLNMIETQFNRLKRTFLRYIDSGRCCFIPGKVIDELFSVFRRLKAEENPSYEMIQELRELRDMAIEYFKEEIVPPLKKEICPSRRNSSGILREVNDDSVFSFHYFSEPLDKANNRVQRMENENKKILELERHIRNQNKVIQQQSNRITEIESKWAEMNRRLENISVGQGGRQEGGQAGGQRGGHRRKTRGRKIEAEIVVEGRVTRSRI